MHSQKVPDGYSIGNMRLLLRDLRAVARRRVLPGSEWYRRCDRSDPMGYLDITPGWQRGVSRYLDSLRQRGEEIVYADVCGRACLSWAQVNYSFSLQPVEYHGYLSGTNAVQGDIFARHDFARFVSRIESAGHRPAWMTFVPVAGLGRYFFPKKEQRSLTDLHRALLFQRLAKQLKLAIGVLRPGGFVLVGPAFSTMYTLEFLLRVPQEEYAACLWAKQLCRENRCDLRIESTLYGPYWLIRKRIR